MIALQRTAWRRIKDSPQEQSEAELLAATEGADLLTRDQTADQAGTTQNDLSCLWNLIILSLNARKNSSFVSSISAHTVDAPLLHYFLFLQLWTSIVRGPYWNTKYFQSESCPHEKYLSTKIYSVPRVWVEVNPECASVCNYCVPGVERLSANTVIWPYVQFQCFS